METLSQRFQRETMESPALLVLRIGNGASVVNKTAHDLDSVVIAPLGSKVQIHDWPAVGDIAAGGSGVVDIAESDPLWRDATQAIVYWVNEAGQRRINFFPIVDVDSSELNGLVP